MSCSRLLLGPALAATLLVAPAEAQGPPAGLVGDPVAEATRLPGPVQLTFREQFVKAGEGYFNPDATKVVFQAVPIPPAGVEPDEFYAMYVADVVRDRDGTISGLTNHLRVSPPGSANTCGWFHPSDPDLLYFATTVTPPTQESAPGYQRSGRYRWQFPPEMRIVHMHLGRDGIGTAASLHPEVGSGQGYVAEGSVSPDGRHMVYASLENGGDSNILVRDLRSGNDVAVVTAPGYDGGPFFSPDGRRLCYRSDRRGDNLLQLFVADLEFDADGAISGMAREHQLTDNGHVNWAPFWHPAGRHLIYASSEVGHYNYEVFAVDADPGDLPGSEPAGSLRYGTRRRRITDATGADVLPVFTTDGTWMMWTSKRGAAETSQLWASPFVMDLDEVPVDGGS